MSNHYNPPADIPKKGRPLIDNSYEELVAQLREGEVLMAFYHADNPALATKYAVAKHIDSSDRNHEMNTDWSHQVITYYACAKTDVNPGMDFPIP